MHNSKVENQAQNLDPKTAEKLKEFRKIILKSFNDHKPLDGLESLYMSYRDFLRSHEVGAPPDAHEKIVMHLHELDNFLNITRRANFTKDYTDLEIFQAIAPFVIKCHGDYRTFIHLFWDLIANIMGSVLLRIPHFPDDLDNLIGGFVSINHFVRDVFDLTYHITLHYEHLIPEE